MNLHARPIMAILAGALLITVAAPRAQDAPAHEIDAQDISVPNGYRIEAVAGNLTVPTTAVFDGDDLLVAESGYNNAGKARVVRIRRHATAEVVAEGGLSAPVTGLAVREGRIYVSHAGKVSVVQGGSLKDIVTGLRHGDH